MTTEPSEFSTKTTNERTTEAVKSTAELTTSGITEASTSAVTESSTVDQPELITKLATGVTTGDTVTTWSTSESTPSEATTPSEAQPKPTTGESDYERMLHAINIRPIHLGSTHRNTFSLKLKT